MVGDKPRAVYTWPWRGILKLLILRPGDHVVITNATNGPARVEGVFVSRSGRNVTLEVEHDAA